ncbi:hypothetical protein VTI74DRAFT_2645 [Chaetomium olivicolor]
MGRLAVPDPAKEQRETPGCGAPSATRRETGSFSVRLPAEVAPSGTVSCPSISLSLPQHDARRAEPAARRRGRLVEARHSPFPIRRAATAFLGYTYLSGWQWGAEVALVQARAGHSLLCRLELVVGDCGIEWTPGSGTKFRPGGGRQGSTDCSGSLPGPLVPLSAVVNHSERWTVRGPKDAPGGGPLTTGKAHSETRYQRRTHRPERCTPRGLLALLCCANA